MSKPKARITEELDGYTKLTIFVPGAFGTSMSTRFAPEMRDVEVNSQVRGIIDALHEALDEVEDDG